jgi:hypothetical protein
MSTVHVIRPHLYYSPGADDAVTPEEAASLMKKHIVATVSSRADAIKTLLLLGWKEDRIAFAMHYGMYGGGSPSLVL